MNSKGEYLVSIITPIYNSRKYLKEAFVSVKRQTIGFKNIELILVDDGSDDGSFKLIEGWAAKYPNVKAYRLPENSGSASGPRNVALGAATSDYIMFLDSDDTYERGAVEYLYGEITRRDVDIVSGAYGNLVGVRRNELDEIYEKKREGYYDFRADMREWLEISHPFTTKIFKTEIIQKHNLRFDTELRNGEDTLFILEYMKYTQKAWHQNQLIYNYRMRENSVSSRYEKRYFTGLLKTYQKIKDALAKTDVFAMYDIVIETTASAYMDKLCDSDGLTDSEYIEILALWKPILKYVGDNGMLTDTAIGTILVDDAKRDDFDAMKFHFFAMRPIYKLRKAQLDDIFNSRAWKLIAAINRILGR